MKHQSRSFFGLTALLFALGACGNDAPPTLEQVQQKSAAPLTGMVEDYGKMLDELIDHPAVSPMLDTLKSIDLVEIDRSKLHFAKDAKEAARELASMLREKIFTQATLVGTSGDALTFRLDDSLFCGEADTVATPPTTPPPAPKPTPPSPSEPQKSCLPQGTEVYLDARLSDDTLSISLRVNSGPAIAVLSLQTGRISLRVDLEAAFVAAKDIANKTGELVDDFPTKMQGVVELTLTHDGAGTRSFALGVVEALAFEMADKNARYAINVDKAPRLVVASYEKQKLSLSIDSGAISVELPSDEIFDTPPSVTGGQSPLPSLTKLALSAQSSVLSLTPDKGLALQLKKVGDFVWTLGQDTLAKIEVKDGVTLTLAQLKKSLVRIAVDGPFEASLTARFAKVANATGQDFPSELLNERYRLALFSPDQRSVLELSELDSEDGQIKVVAGTLTYEQVESGKSLTVKANQCIGDSGAKDAPLIIDYLAIVPCQSAP
jgi:hypothetical protein